MAITTSFDEKNNGWTSNWSFIPESYVKMKGNIYTFKKGKIALHNVESAPMNRFYDEDGNYEIFDSHIEVVFNQSPSEVKEFKTVCVESNINNLDVLVESNIDEGHINSSNLVSREGEHYGFIRRNSNSTLNFDLLSIQGIGVPTSVVGNVFTFSSIPGVVSVGDVLCVYNPLTSGYEAVSTVASYNSSSITINTPVSPFVYPSNGVVFVAKNPIAESYGVKGVYAKVKLVTVNPSQETVVFAVNSEVVKSFQ